MAAFTLGPYRLEVAEDFGPRITAVVREDSPDLLARLDDSVSIDRGDQIPYLFRGGHRLWASPETPSITYAPDDHRTSVDSEDGVVRVWAAADGADLVKELAISVEDDILRVDHKVTFGRLPMAAWGITQLQLGGTAILALPDEDTSPLPNRAIVLWPYTDVGDRRLAIANDHIAVAAEGETPIKLGVGPGRSRLGYFHDGWLFEKWAEADPGEVPDLGAASQIYVGQGFCELETVGTLRPPREPALLTERWRLSPCPDLATAMTRLTGVAG